MLLQICSAPWTSYPHCREKRAVGGGGGGVNASVVWLHSGAQAHASKEKRCVYFPQRHEVCAFAEKAWCDYRHKPLVKEHSTLLGHLQCKGIIQISCVSQIHTVQGNFPLLWPGLNEERKYSQR